MMCGGVGSIENNAIGLSWGVNAEGTGVDVTLRSGNTRSWLGFGISRDDKMVRETLRHCIPAL